MLPVELYVEDLTLRILQGHEKFVHFTSVMHNDLPATQVVFYPESKTQTGCFIFQGCKAWRKSGIKPGFVIGIINKRGGHIQIDQTPSPLTVPEPAFAG